MLFYDGGYRARVQAAMYAGGYDWTDCGARRETYLSDGRHGGTNRWHGQEVQYEQRVDGIGQCVMGEPRHYLRLWPSTTGDTHYPGLGWYAPAEIHYEGWGHTNPDPQRGQDHFLAAASGNPYIGRIEFLRLYTSPDSCRNCSRWDGWLDIYQLPFHSTGDTCGGQPVFSQSIAPGGFEYVYIVCA